MPSGLQQNGDTEGNLMALDVTAHVSLYGLPPHFLAVGPFEAPCCCLFLVPFPEPKSVLGVYLVTAAEPRKAHWERWGEMVNREYHKPGGKNFTRVARIPKSMQPLQHFVVRQRSGTTWSRWFVWMWMHGLPGTTGSVRVSLSRHRWVCFTWPYLSTVGGPVGLSARAGT